MNTAKIAVTETCREWVGKVLLSLRRSFGISRPYGPALGFWAWSVDVVLVRIACSAR